MAKAHRSPRIAKKRSSLARCNGWVAYIDIFGFGVELKEPTLKDVSDRLSQLHTSIEAETSVGNGLNVYMLSDSIVVFCPDEHISRARSLTKLINFLVKIETAAVDLDFVFRGVISHGDIMLVGRVCLVPPLLKAVLLEAQ